MKTVEISDAAFERLRPYAKPLEDTVDTVINRLLDELERSKKEIEILKCQLENINNDLASLKKGNDANPSPGETSFVRDIDRPIASA
ncbi:MAG: prefoldin subunit [Geminicoccaceae bacterium]|nr:prefoldin subunit [Geminicoccaceae bacterium]